MLKSSLLSRGCEKFAFKTRNLYPFRLFAFSTFTWLKVSHFGKPTGKFHLRKIYSFRNQIFGPQFGLSPTSNCLIQKIHDQHFQRHNDLDIQIQKSTTYGIKVLHFPDLFKANKQNIKFKVTLIVTFWYVPCNKIFASVSTLQENPFITFHVQFVNSGMQIKKRMLGG